jgi:CheY-like chemotaxis protein
MRTITPPRTVMITVLYVDDEAAFLEIGRLFLEDGQELSVDTAVSAKEALAFPKLREYDVIVADYLMPGINGIEFLRQIRGSGNPVPFILFTGKGREEIVIQALNEGADFYLQKGGEPVSQFAELKHQIRTAVQRRRAETELRKREQEVRINENRLKNAQAIAHTGSWEYNPATGKIWGSDEGFRIYGMVPPEDNYLPIAAIEACIPEQKRVHQALVDLLERNLPYDLEFAINPADGSPQRIITSLAEVLRDPEGRILKVTGVIQDITERRKAERALRRSEERLHLVTDNLPDSYVYQYTHTPEGKPAFLFISRGVERLHPGITVEDVLRDASVLHNRIEPDQLQVLREAENASARDMTDFSMELRYRSGCGELRLLHARSRPRRDADGRIIWEGLATDITGLRQTME